MRVRQPYLRNGDEEGAVCVCGREALGVTEHICFSFSLFYLFCFPGSPHRCW